MIRAYRLYTGTDGNSHVTRGNVNGDKLVGAESIHFKETAPHSRRWQRGGSPGQIDGATSRGKGGLFGCARNWRHAPRGEGSRSP
jgi:hypothetical protein